MSEARIGTELAGHRIISVIGRGGMSVVYLAEHLELGRKVALKVLGPDLAEDDAFRERFIRESRITAGLEHPNIVTVFDAGEADGVLYISMRYVEGTDLERLLRSERRLDPERAVSIVNQAAAGLDAAHGAGLVHRDVKPGNILLQTDPGSSADRVYLSDFGVTKRVDTEASLTRTGQFVGTVDYVAPEQIRGGDVDGRADIYSLGCVAYRCLTGEVPFPRDTEVATIYAQLQDAPPVPSERRPGLPPGFDAPIGRALAKAPDDRFGTARAFADEMDEVLHPPSRHVDEAHHEPSEPRTPRRPRVLIWSGFALLAALVVAGFALLPDRDGDRSGASGSPGSHDPLPSARWRPVSDRNGVFTGPGTQAIADVASAGDTIVAVGYDDGGGTRDAAVWTSTHGTRWLRTASDAFGRTGDQWMDGIAVAGSGLVAVGAERTGGDADPAVWLSTDGGSRWSRVEGATSGLHGTGDQAMRVVVDAAPGMVAAGSDASSGDLDAAVWTSKNGSSWTSLSLGILGGPGDQQILDAATLDERLIVVGSASSSAGDLDAAVWVRSVGAWTKILDGSFGGEGDQQINALVQVDQGLAAVGSTSTHGDLRPAVWTSTDGQTWDRVPTSHIPTDDTGTGSMSTLAMIGTTIAAGGWMATSGGAPEPIVWLSTDGSRWRSVPVTTARGRDQRISSLVALTSDRLIAAGSRGTPEELDAAAWLGRLVPANENPDR